MPSSLARPVLPTGRCVTSSSPLSTDTILKPWKPTSFENIEIYTDHLDSIQLGLIRAEHILVTLLVSGDHSVCFISQTEDLELTMTCRMAFWLWDQYCSWSHPLQAWGCLVGGLRHIGLTHADIIPGPLVQWASTYSWFRSRWLLGPTLSEACWINPRHISKLWGSGVLLLSSNKIFSIWQQQSCPSMWGWVEPAEPYCFRHFLCMSFWPQVWGPHHEDACHCLGGCCGSTTVQCNSLNSFFLPAIDCWLWVASNSCQSSLVTQ